jgi:hypothetical protein
MPASIIAFLAIVLTGFATIAPMAHLFELPHKIGMTEDDYFTVQRIYQGWWMVGLALPAAFIADLALAFVARSDRWAFGLALAAAALIVVNLAIFIIWTQPANSATVNWTQHVADWRTLRPRWEYSHAVNAGVTLLAFWLVVAAALRARG